MNEPAEQYDGLPGGAPAGPEDNDWLLAELIPQIVWTARPDGYLDYYNQRWYAYTGLTWEQTKGWGWELVIHPDDLQACLDRWSHAVATGGSYEIEYRFRRGADGSYRWHLGRALPIRDSAGQILRWFGTCTDIDDQKRAAERRQFVVEAGTLLASSLDYETALAGVARLSVPALADWCAIDLYDHKGAVRRVALARTDRADEPRVSELDPRSYMILPLTVRGRPLGSITLVMADSQRTYSSQDRELAEELTARAAFAVENAHLHHEAQMALRMRDAFVSIASHELKTPLTSLIGFADALRRRAVTKQPYTLTERDQRALGMIGQQAYKLDQLIDSMLDLGRIQSGRLTIERQPMDLWALVQQTAEEQFSSDLHPIDLRGPSQPVIIDGDELRLGQVLRNLVQNAIKYTPSGGQIELAVAVRDGFAHLCVRDQGLGIPRDALTSLFRPFFRVETDETAHIKGMGIGLYVVHEVVTLHGGTIDVQSEPGVGSTFTVRLPLRGGAS